ncbi:Ras-related protein RABH1b [Zea mays]|uniref:ACT domain-containing protein ACR n=1 Tax=Zea mays TaxID=4577 RepID=A0A1D6J0M3_MAIZE|nr:Ras-related protein RABH1b [Zea mays]
MEGDPACGLALADEEAECSSWDSDDEYQKFIQNMNPPRVTIDNTSCPSAIVIHYGILLEVVQVLTNLKLIVTKAYISSDGGWFMDGRCHQESVHRRRRSQSTGAWCYVHGDQCKSWVQRQAPIPQDRWIPSRTRRTFVRKAGRHGRHKPQTCQRFVGFRCSRAAGAEIRRLLLLRLRQFCVQRSYNSTATSS